jgi:hypothetical protein
MLIKIDIYSLAVKIIMKNKILQKRLSLSSWIILAAGLIVAAMIFIFTSPEAVDNLANPLLSKKYLHDLEVYGGRANVIQDEFLRWFEGLWLGRQLAGTIAFITGFVFLIIRLILSPFRLNTPGDYEIQRLSQKENKLDPSKVPVTLSNKKEALNQRIHNDR